MRFDDFSSFYLGATMMAISSTGLADESCQHRMMPPYPKSIGEMVDRSSYIGLYVAKSVQPAGKVEKMGSGDTDADGSVDIFDYELGLAQEVKGAPPMSLIIPGREPPKTIPSIYFELFYRHEDLVKYNTPSFGIAATIVDRGALGCEHIPEFVTGYSYLIFGGINSKARFEPIFSTTRDAFYSEVWRLLAKR